MIKVKKNNNKAWVTFTYVPKEGEESVSLVGSWSEWKEEKMKKKKNGDFYLTKILPLGVIYEFRYFVDGKKWINDEDAIEVHNNFGGTNSAIDLSV
jgi:hypothetical protein